MGSELVKEYCLSVLQDERVLEIDGCATLNVFNINELYA